MVSLSYEIFPRPPNRSGKAVTLPTTGFTDLTHWGKFKYHPKH